MGRCVIPLPQARRDRGARSQKHGWLPAQPKRHGSMWGWGGLPVCCAVVSARGGQRWGEAVLCLAGPRWLRDLAGLWLQRTWVRGHLAACGCQPPCPVHPQDGVAGPQERVGTSRLTAAPSLSFECQLEPGLGRIA